MVGPQISVFLADDNLLVREGVRALLSLEADLHVVGVAADRIVTMREAGSTTPNPSHPGRRRPT